MSSGIAKGSSPQGSCMASRYFFASLGLGSASAARCFGLASVSNQVSRPQLGLITFGSARSRSFHLILPLPQQSCSGRLDLPVPIVYDRIRNETGSFDWRQYSMTIGAFSLWLVLASG